MSQIVVPTDTPGFSVSRKLDKLGNRSSDTAELSLVDVRVPVANTIGEIGRGFQQQMAQFQNERMIAAYMAVGGMQAALERTIAYVKRAPGLRRTRWPPTSTSSSRWPSWSPRSTWPATTTTPAPRPTCRGEDTTRFATIAKLKTGRLNRRVADVCLQFHGGIGYMEETWTARYFRDSRLLSIGGGADEVMLRVLAQLDGIGVTGSDRSSGSGRPSGGCRSGPCSSLAQHSASRGLSRRWTRSPWPSGRPRFHTSQTSSGGSHSSMNRTGSSRRSRRMS